MEVEIDVYEHRLTVQGSQLELREAGGDAGKRFYQVCVR